MHTDLVYVLQNKVELALYIFSDRLHSEQFFFYIRVPRKYLYFFDSRKTTISVFYMREHTELVYILQNRVEKGTVYFS